MATTSLQIINWLSKKVFLELQVHKDSKLRIMTNVCKNRLVKVIFTNIHKISDARANSFGIYIMIAQYMKNDFTFY